MRRLEGVCVCEAAVSVWTVVAIAAWSRSLSIGSTPRAYPPVAQDDVPWSNLNLATSASTCHTIMVLFWTHDSCCCTEYQINACCTARLSIIDPSRSRIRQNHRALDFM